MKDKQELLNKAIEYYKQAYYANNKNDKQVHTIEEVKKSKPEYIPNENDSKYKINFIKKESARYSNVLIECMHQLACNSDNLLFIYGNSGKVKAINKDTILKYYNKTHGQYAIRKCEFIFTGNNEYINISSCDIKAKNEIIEILSREKTDAYELDSKLQESIKGNFNLKKDSYLGKSLTHTYWLKSGLVEVEYYKLD